MTPPALAGIGVVLLIAGGLVLRSFGVAYRLGRLLATVRPISIEAAIAAGQAGDGRYVRVDGRIDSETDFEDEHHRPLVFRRRRLEVREAAGWRALDDQREAVAFEIRAGLAGIAVDTDAIDEGLVVIPREAVGTAAEARDYVPASVKDGAPVRMRVQQVSSVEHAVVLGVPVERADGSVALSAGAGRPLIVSTLEPDEAIRMLAGGRRTRPALAAGLLVGGGGLMVLAAGWAIAEAVH